MLFSAGPPGAALQEGAIRKTVLVIDDDITSRSIICRVADRAGFAAIGVASVEEAELLIGSHVFDLVTLDIALGAGTAHDMLEALARLSFDKPIVVVSGMDPASVEAVMTTARGRDLRLLDGLMKPIDLGALKACFERVLVAPA
ncbi:response regulator [Rhodoplanes elegans]|uniref:response regulator n=1 Tax=Rhodoplanes elegans TaxID=29408 RepID=UPI001476273B|nr:response regulator [Rhodoplanes elegans]